MSLSNAAQELFTAIGDCDAPTTNSPTALKIVDILINYVNDNTKYKYIDKNTLHDLLQPPHNITDTAELLKWNFKWEFNEHDYKLLDTTMSDIVSSHDNYYIRPLKKVMYMYMLKKGVRINAINYEYFEKNISWEILIDCIDKDFQLPAIDLRNLFENSIKDDGVNVIIFNIFIV